MPKKKLCVFPGDLKNVKRRSKIAFFRMSAVTKSVFQKWKQLHFSDENDLSYTKERHLHVTIGKLGLTAIDQLPRGEISCYKGVMDCCI